MCVGMEIRIRVSILETKCTVLESTTLRMDIVMKGLGTKVVNKAVGCIRLEIVSRNVENGIVATSRTLLLLLSRDLSLEQFR